MSSYFNTFGITPGAKSENTKPDNLGGKGYELSRMSSMGLPVPPGVTVTIDAYRDANSGAVSTGTLAAGVLKHLPKNCMFSARSGAPVSMPGMMDTVLNVGIFEHNLDYWIGFLGEAAALDCYRRFLQMYGEVVLGIPAPLFANALEEVKDGDPEVKDSDLSAHSLSVVVDRFKEIYSIKNQAVPVDLVNTIAACIGAVFHSFNSERAIAYRKKHKLPSNMGTAVTIQKMVFGNWDKKSCSGVLFTSNPATGENGIVGEFLEQAQGEDVVAGIRTPLALDKLYAWNADIHAQLFDVSEKLVKANKDMQDIEFTVESGKLYILQTRSGKRTGRAAFRIAYYLANTGVISKPTAVKRVTLEDYASCLVDVIDPAFSTEADFTGTPASPGIGQGKVSLSSKSAESMADHQPVVLVTQDTCPDDFAGMAASQAILTRTGGHTSHAAVVARGMNIPAVVGCSSLPSDLTALAGKSITIDGATGRVWVDKKVPVIPGKLDNYINSVIGWGAGSKMIASSLSEKVTTYEEAEAYVTGLNMGASVELFTGSLASEEAGAYWTLGLILDEMRKQDITGILNLSPMASIHCLEDEDFLVGLSMSATTTGSTNPLRLAAQVKPLGFKKWTKKFKKAVSVKIPAGNQALVNEVRAMGWTVLSEVGSKEELLAGGGVVTEEYKAKINALGFSLQEFSTLLKKAGVNVQIHPNSSIPASDLVLEVLG